MTDKVQEVLAAEEDGPARESTMLARQQPHQEAVSVAHMLQLAIEKDMSVEGLEKLVALHERVADRLAAQEFADALAAFQQECPPITKNKTQTIATKSGRSYPISYATLDEIARTVRPLLHKHGLSYTWDSEVVDGNVDTVCRLRHRNGHQETARFRCPIETTSGMSEQHKHQSALSFGRRGSLVSALGLTTADPDAEGGADPSAKISADQVVRLEEALDGLKFDRDRFFKLLGRPDLTRFADIPQVLYPAALNFAMAKRRQQEQKKAPPAKEGA